MAKLKFPLNQSVIEGDTARQGFGSQWLRYLNEVHKRIAGLDDVASVATANVTAAPGAYSQAHIDTIVTLLNEIKAKQNIIIETLKG